MNDSVLEWFDVVYIPAMLGLFSYALSQLPKENELSIFLLLYDKNSKTEEWIWVSGDAASKKQSGNTFLEFKNDGLCFIQSISVELVLADETTNFYVIPHGLSAGGRHILQVDCEMESIRAVTVVCRSSPTNIVFIFSGRISKSAQKGVFDTWETTDICPRIDVEIYRCHLKANSRNP